MSVAVCHARGTSMPAGPGASYLQPLPTLLLQYTNMNSRTWEHAAVAFLHACCPMQALPLEEWHRRLCQATLVREVGVLRFEDAAAMGRCERVGGRASAARALPPYGPVRVLG